MEYLIFSVRIDVVAVTLCRGGGDEPASWFYGKNKLQAETWNVCSFTSSAFAGQRPSKLESQMVV